jgi:hypothetical protein
MKALNDDYVAIDHALYPSLSWSMNTEKNHIILQQTILN